MTRQATGNPAVERPPPPRKQPWRQAKGVLGPAAVALAACLSAACAPARLAYDPDTEAMTPAWAGTEAFRARDGQGLGVERWPVAAGAPRLVVIAVHGLNEHAGRFARPAAAWAERGLLVYAYDQRGFGAAAEQDLWPGDDALVLDLIDFAGLVAETHPGVPIALVGDSMGAAVILSALTEAALPKAVRRAVLVVPAVRGRESLGPFRSAGLWIIAHIAPGYTVATEDSVRDLSEDRGLTERMLAEPGFRKTIRIDTVWGLTDLMDRAVEAAPQIDRPVLVVAGGEDDLVPPGAVEALIAKLPPALTETCYRPFSGHLVLYERLEARGLRPEIRPEDLWQATADWMLSGTLSALCK